MSQVNPTRREEAQKRIELMYDRLSTSNIINKFARQNDPFLSR